MIDDARFFLKPPPPPQNSELWPGLKEILDLLNKDESYFTFVSEDVMVTLPTAAENLFSLISMKFTEMSSPEEVYYRTRYLLEEYIKEVEK